MLGNGILLTDGCIDEEVAYQTQEHSTCLKQDVFDYRDFCLAGCIKTNEEVVEIPGARISF